MLHLRYTQVGQAVDSLQHTATHCNTLQHTAIRTGGTRCRFAATHQQPCHSLHHTASYCTTLHHTAPYCTAPHRTAPHCNTLQHRNTLQHTQVQQAVHLLGIHVHTRIHTHTHTHTHTGGASGGFAGRVGEAEHHRHERRSATAIGTLHTPQSAHGSSTSRGHCRRSDDRGRKRARVRETTREGIRENDRHVCQKSPIFYGSFRTRALYSRALSAKEPYFRALSANGHWLTG